METRAFGPFVRRKHKAAANTAQWLEPREQTRYGLMPFHKNRRDAKLLLEAARKGRGGSGGAGR